MNGYKIVLLKAIFMLYKLPESERVCSGICNFLKEEDFLYYKEQLPVYFQYVILFGFEQEGILIGFMRIAEGNLEMLFITNNY
jgi:putative acetyltransferase